MQRQGFEIPLLIGGATTSRAHTAVKIATRSTTPRWCGSRTPPARCRWPRRCSAARSATGCWPTSGRTTTRCATRHAARHDRPLLSIEEARARRTPVDWGAGVAAAPARPGVHVFEDYDLAELRDYIDWQPFFNAWELKGSYPSILDDEVVGEAARGSTTTPWSCWTGSSPRGCCAPAASSASPRGERGRRHRGLRRRRALRGARRDPPAAAAGRAPRGHPQQVPGRLRRPAGVRPARPPRSLRRDRRARA